MIYLDNASTTKPSSAAVAAARQTIEDFGNPSSLHGLGLKAEKIVADARRAIASVLGVKDKQIYFVSGGTEANNTAIFGAAMQKHKQGNHIITTKIEHPSVLDAFRELERNGYRVTYLDVNTDGIVNLQQLLSVLDSDTVLVSIMNVNNETGVIQPIHEIKALLREKAPKALFHVDAVQSFGKIPVQPQKWGVDLLSISAHKVHGIKGTGALYIADGVHIHPLFFGGGQQNNIRPGTENVTGIAAFGAAVKEFDVAKTSQHLLQLRCIMSQRILSELQDVKINGSNEYSSGSVLNVSFLGIKAEILLHALEARGVYVSTGSACSTHKPAPSHVLSAMGCTAREIHGAIRFSFDIYTSAEDIHTAVDILKEEVARIPKIK